MASYIGKLGKVGSIEKEQLKHCESSEYREIFNYWNFVLRDFLQTEAESIANEDCGYSIADIKRKIGDKLYNLMKSEVKASFVEMNEVPVVVKVNSCLLEDRRQAVREIRETVGDDVVPVFTNEYRLESEVWNLCNAASCIFNSISDHVNNERIYFLKKNSCLVILFLEYVLRNYEYVIAEVNWWRTLRSVFRMGVDNTETISNGGVVGSGVGKSYTSNNSRVKAYRAIRNSGRSMMANSYAEILKLVNRGQAEDISISNKRCNKKLSKAFPFVVATIKFNVPERVTKGLIDRVSYFFNQLHERLTKKGLGHYIYVHCDVICDRGNIKLLPHIHACVSVRDSGQDQVLDILNQFCLCVTYKGNCYEFQHVDKSNIDVLDDSTEVVHLRSGVCQDVTDVNRVCRYSGFPFKVKFNIKVDSGGYLIADYGGYQSRFSLPSIHSMLIGWSMTKIRSISHGEFRESVNRDL